MMRAVVTEYCWVSCKLLYLNTDWLTELSADYNCLLFYKRKKRSSTFHRTVVYTFLRTNIIHASRRMFCFASPVWSRFTKKKVSIELVCGDACVRGIIHFVMMYKCLVTYCSLFPGKRGKYSRKYIAFYDLFFNTTCVLYFIFDYF